VVGDTATIHAAITPPNAEDQTVTWLSSKAQIVTVNSNGLLTAKKAGNAKITVSTNDGDLHATAEIEVYDAEHAPQGFSPNGDGVNDYFELTLVSKETYTLNVFDRSGQLYYQSNNYKNDWDGIANTGTHSGKKLLSGTYYYSLVGKTSGRVKTGFVVIRY
jgi:gliding motility-associated-like protein